MTTICRPFITLKNGKVLFASVYGLKAFCFEVNEEKQKSPKDKSKGDSDVKTVSNA